MGIKIGPLTVLLLGSLCMASAVPANASAVATTYNYEYSINIPDVGATFNLEWVGAPLNGNGTGYGSNSWASTPTVAGYSVYLTPWTAATDITQSSPQDSEILVEYTDASGKLYVYSFIEPDSFWATTGTNLLFPSATNDDVWVGVTSETYVLDPVTGLPQYTVNMGTVAIGANLDDPQPCTDCTVTISEVATNPTPEPSALWLLGSGLVGLVGMARRKFALRA